MAKSETIHLRVRPELKAALRDEAARRFVDVTTLVSLVLGEWLEANGRSRLDLGGPRAPDVSPPPYGAPDSKK